MLTVHNNYKYNNLGVLKTFFSHFFGGGVVRVTL